MHRKIILNKKHIKMRVLTLFTTLTGTEQRRLGKYLEAFETDQNVILLFKYFKKYQNKSKWLNEESMFLGIYKTEFEEDNKRKFTILRNKLAARIKNFIIHDRLTAKEHSEFRLDKELIILEYIGNKLNSSDLNDKYREELYGEYMLMLGQVKKTASSQKRDIFYYANLWRLYHLDYFNLNTRKWKGQKEFVDLIKNFQKFYCLAMLRYATEQLTRQQIKGEKQVFELPQDVYLKSDEFSKNEVLFEIYRLHYDILNSFEKEKFETIKNTIKDDSKRKQIKRGEVAYIVGLLSNHIASEARKINSDINSIQQTLDLYDFAFENDIFLMSGYIDVMLILNYVFLSVEANEIDKIGSILTIHIKRVRKHHRKHAKGVVQAYFHFGKGNFKEAYSTLADIGFKSSIFYLHQRTLKIKSLYEIEVTQGESYSDRVFLKVECEHYRDNLIGKKHEKKISSQTYQANQHFIDFVELLYKEDGEIKKKYTAKKLFEMLDNQQIAGKGWLGRKIEALYK